MKHQPERTCIGCRNVFTKDEVVRIVSGPAGIAIDYREKLPGRAAYVCPRPDCIQKAFGKGNLAKALRLKIRLPGTDEFIVLLAANIEGKIKSLIVMAAKAGKLAAGYSAVLDALEKKRVEMLLYAQDISEGTRAKVALPETRSMRQASLFTRDGLGKLLNRELVGVIGIEDKGFADAVWKETERLKVLINNNG
jgi:predicted RNA-binding protein YlxR (DUF448 family)